jgi:intraflagellar transport protein 122
VACLGVTHKDWDLLGRTAMEASQFDVARKAFIHTRDYKYLNLITQLLEMKRQGGLKNDVIAGYILAYQSKFSDAAKAFRRAGEENLALALFTDLRMFDMAKEYISGQSDTDKTSIMLKQAEWAIRNGDTKTAAELYMSAKQYGKAIDLAGKANWADMLLEIVRKLDKADSESLSKCAEHFRRMNMMNFAAEVYEKMGNIKELIELRMESQQWEEVFALAKKYPDLNNLALYKYGQWLAENDKFEEAQQAFNDAGFKKEAIKVLEELTFNAVVESRFNDASYYYFLLSKEYLQIASGNLLYFSGCH